MLGAGFEAVMEVLGADFQVENWWIWGWFLVGFFEVFWGCIMPRD